MSYPAGEGTDAHAIGLGFVGPGVVDLPLLHQPHRRSDGGLRGVAAGTAAGRLRQHDGAQHAQQDRDLVALRAFHAAQHVLLGDMRDLVRQDGGHLILAVRGQHQAGIHADVAAQRGEGIDLPVAHHEEGVGLLGVVAVGAQAVAHGLQPVGDQRVFQQIAVVAQLAQHHAAVLGLAGRREQLACGRADVGKPAVLRRSQRGGKGQGQGGGEQQWAQMEAPWRIMTPSSG